MEERSGLESWIEVVRKYMPQLSKPQARVLAMWSFGIMITGKSGLSSVSAFLGNMLKQKENTVRQCLRELYKEGEAKKGEQRQTLEVTSSFGPLLSWVLSWWATGEQHLALALDASALGDRFVVLAIRVVYRGCAIPVAWKLLPANQKGAWKPHWLELFSHLRETVPATWTVIVLADRGLYARWLYQHIISLGWHPFLRINLGGMFHPVEKHTFRELLTVVPQVGDTWSGRVVCFKTNPLTCTLLARWEAGYTHPWLILTDLAPEQAEVCWYGLRTWIECGFKDMKRGGWQWQYTRITDHERATRFWLVLAVATLWAVSVGGEADASLPAPGFDALPDTHIARRRSSKRFPTRLLSCFRRGTLVILASLLSHQPLPLGRFFPEPWPDTVPRFLPFQHQNSVAPP